MAKAVTLFNVSSGKLITPDGTEVLPGDPLDLTKDLAENAGVKSWIEDGLLGATLPAKAQADLSEENARLSAENEALTAQVAQLTADLSAATAPQQ